MNTAKQINKQLSGIPSFSSLATTRAILRRHLWLWPILAALVFGGVGWWVHHSVESAMREEQAAELTAILNADVEALRIWSKDQAAIAQVLAEQPALRPSVRELLDKKGAPATVLPGSRALADIRALLAPPLKTFGYVDFFVVTPSMEVLAAGEDSLLKLPIEGYRRSFAEQVLHGRPAVSLPFRSVVMLRDARGVLRADVPTMVVGAAIPDEQGKPLAVLALRLRPEAQFTAILQTARSGESGETYAFAADGLLLSQSRFDSDLKHVGLLPDTPESQSILTMELRDPQANIMAGERPSLRRAEQPLTGLVAQAKSDGAAVEIAGYRDYRGVPSVGAAQWLPEFGFGVLTRVDEAEAYRPLYVLRRAVWTLFGLLLCSAAVMAAGTVVIARQQRQVEKAQQAIKQLGQYTLEEKIGSGGMGSVYRARHTFLRRPTAVKMLNTEQVTAGAIARFEREVQLTSNLNHPNTIAVYDYGRTSDGVFYYAMEYLEGIDLEKLVKNYGSLPEGRVIDILKQVCGSLAEAHGIGLIHRDVKPANIILTARAGLIDFVKVLDFGLVKVVDAEEESKLTQANTLLGTPYYMSPEAVEQPDSITAQSDVYAIGAVGYFLLTGTTVFTGKTIMDVCMKHAHAVPDPPSKRLSYPICPALEAVLLQCLAKDPKDRPQGTRTLLDQLAQCRPAQTWTQADAAAWWSMFQRTAGPAAAPKPTAVG
jgi:hypothetical protein